MDSEELHQLFQRMQHCLWEDEYREDKDPTPSEFPALLREYIAQGGDLNYADPVGGFTLLLLTCEYQDAPAARLLLEAGADVNCEGGKGFSPFALAQDSVLDGSMQTGTPIDWAILKVLLEHGADIHQGIPEGQTFEWHYTQRWGPEMVKGLLDVVEKHRRTK